MLQNFQIYIFDITTTLFSHHLYIRGGLYLCRSHNSVLCTSLEISVHPGHTSCSLARKIGPTSSSSNCSCLHSIGCISINFGHVPLHFFSCVDTAYIPEYKIFLTKHQNSDVRCLYNSGSGNHIPGLESSKPPGLLAL